MWDVITRWARAGRSDGVAGEMVGVGGGGFWLGGRGFMAARRGDDVGRIEVWIRVLGENEDILRGLSCSARAERGMGDRRFEDGDWLIQQTSSLAESASFVIILFDLVLQWNEAGRIMDPLSGGLFSDIDVRPYLKEMDLWESGSLDAGTPPYGILLMGYITFLKN